MSARKRYGVEQLQVARATVTAVMDRRRRGDQAVCFACTMRQARRIAAALNDYEQQRFYDREFAKAMAFAKERPVVKQI